MAHLLVKVANLVSRVNNNEIEDKTIYVPKTEDNNPPTLNLDGVHHNIYVDNTDLGSHINNKTVIILNITPTFKTVNIFLTKYVNDHSFYIKINRGTETRYFVPITDNLINLIKLSYHSVTNGLYNSIYVEYKIYNTMYSDSTI